MLGVLYQLSHNQIGISDRSGALLNMVGVIPFATMNNALNQCIYFNSTYELFMLLLNRESRQADFYARKKKQHV